MRALIAPRLLALMLVLMLALAVPAAAEGCALCGRETGSDVYLCADCLLDMMAEKDVAGGLSMEDVTVNEDGSVTLRWTDAADNAPYSVYYEPLNASPVPFGWTAAAGVQGCSVTLSQLAPGVSYVFAVENAAGNRAEKAYYAPAPENGNDIGAKIRIHTKVRYDDKDLYLPFSAEEIMQDNGREHGVYLKLAYSMLRRTRDYAFCVTVEAPNGFKDVVMSGRLMLNYGKSEVPAWGFVSLETFFNCLQDYYGGVPAGEYLVTMNFNGKPAHTVRFEVGA